MSRTRQVVVQGGGANLYQIYESGRSYTAYRVKVGLLSNDKASIGTAASLDDALALIRSHSGRQIARID
jgi:hypothetical protein